MQSIVVGINHKTAPIEIREKFYLTSLEQEFFLSELKNNPSITEAFVLSTCNRTEIYALPLDPVDGTQPILEILFKVKKINFQSDLNKYFYTYHAEKCLEHLINVVAGLDSLMLGEKQILGQFKNAIDVARDKAILGKYFNILSNTAIRAGKKARHETLIGFGGSSISWAAVAMAEKSLESLEDKSVLIIGAGKMSKLAAHQLKNKGVRKIYVINRTHAHAINLAEGIGGEVIPFSEIKETLRNIDVCICSAGAPHYILEKDLIQTVMIERQGRPLLFIDISVPRNIDPQVADIDNVCLYSVDDLDKVVGDNMKNRQAAVPQVKKIISNKMDEFYQKLEKLKDYEFAGCYETQSTNT